MQNQPSMQTACSVWLFKIVCFKEEQQGFQPLVAPSPAAMAALENALSPRELGGRLLPRLEPLLVRLQRQDVLLLQFPLGWTVAQLDGQRILPQNLQGQRTFRRHQSLKSPWTTQAHGKQTRSWMHPKVKGQQGKFTYL